MYEAMYKNNNMHNIHIELLQWKKKVPKPRKRLGETVTTLIFVEITVHFLQGSFFYFEGHTITLFGFDPY